MRNIVTLDKIQDSVPVWAPEPVSMYIAYEKFGLSMREIARQLCIQPSTVSRALKAVKKKQDDPLFKSGLERVAAGVEVNLKSPHSGMDALQPLRSHAEGVLQPDVYHRESTGLLEKLLDNASYLLVALDLQTAAVSVCLSGKAAGNRRAVDTLLVETLVLRGYLKLKRLDKILLYSPTPEAVRQLRKQKNITDLKRLYLASHRDNPIHHDSALRASKQLQVFGRQNMKANNACNRETPFMALVRLRDKSGKSFLSQNEIYAGQKLMEDFELDRIIASSERDRATNRGVSEKLRSVLSWNPCKRLDNALEFIGPVLADIAVRCCCHQQGMNQIEKELEWSARSGKIVLRIALAQLAVFYSRKNTTKSIQFESV